jgi:putative component of membrane protein insertase Oxa1/YidC/SpoIIIJ protein YidD
MSDVLRFVRRRKVLLVALALFSALAADSLCSPSKQIAARAYLVAAHAYQRVGRPAVSRWVHRRCQPTCSEYSVQAVHTLGITKGLFLTARRLVSCLRASVQACAAHTLVSQQRLPNNPALQRTPDSRSVSRPDASGQAPLN